MTMAYLCLLLFLLFLCRPMAALFTLPDRSTRCSNAEPLESLSVFEKKNAIKCKQERNRKQPIVYIYTQKNYAKVLFYHKNVLIRFIHRVLDDDVAATSAPD